MHLLVMDRGKPTIPEGWKLVPNAFVEWRTADGKVFRDQVYRMEASKGMLTIPPHDGHDGGGWHGIPHAVVIPKDG